VIFQTDYGKIELQKIS